MSTIAALLEKMQNLNIEDVINTTFDDTAKDLAAINRERMLDGVRADGSVMPYYSKTSQEVYGYPNAPIMLKDTGDFQAAIEVSRQGSILSTDSTDWKTQMLQDRYGLIFGTYGDYKTQYLEDNYRPVFNQKVTSAIGLKFG